MPINLTKGQKISLSKEAPNLKIALVGLGWDIKQYDSGADFDLDASIFLLDNTGKCAHDSDFIFYNNLSSGGVTHSGDNRTGEGEGDDEAVTIEFEKVPSYVEKIVVTVTIYEAQARGQNFGQVANAFVRLVDKQTGVELLGTTWARIILRKQPSSLRRSTATTANGNSLRLAPASTAGWKPCAVNTV